MHNTTHPPSSGTSELAGVIDVAMGEIGVGVNTPQLVSVIATSILVGVNWGASAFREQAEVQQIRPQTLA